MTLQENISLKPFNTFRVDAKASFFVQINSRKDVIDLVSNYPDIVSNCFVLGGGSNVLFSRDYKGLVLLNNLKGIEVESQNTNTVTLNVASGENWHTFVMWTAQQGWSGVENMAYIPGTMGAAPVQNLAAYGQTFEDVLVSLEAIDLDTGEEKVFNKKELDLAYRSSVFKTKLVNKYFITSVKVRLATELHYDTHYHGRFAYESLATWIKQIKDIPPYTPQDIAEAIILQRKAKLPEVSDYGTCGSFFVNPFVTVEKFQLLSQEIPELQHYPITKMEYDRIDWHDTGQDKIVKIPAGRLLDELGWRGKWKGNVGTYDKHALIVVTNGNASGDEIVAFAGDMKQSVNDTYGIELVSEIRII